MSGQANGRRRVVIYMPFYSGACEARHARMHDAIHEMNRRNDLDFDYKVVAERGREQDSPRVSYTVLPFLRRYTSTYQSMRRGASPTIMRTGDTPPSRPARSSSKNTTGSSYIFASTAGQSSERVVRVVVNRTVRLAVRTRIVVNRAARLAVRATKLIMGDLAELERLVRQLCVTHLMLRCLFAGRADVLHIVRPNRTSRRLARIFARRNPGLKVIVGPNIMSYRSLGQDYDPGYFQGAEVDSVVAVGSHHIRLLEDFGVPADKLVRLPPSVDPAFFAPVPRATQDRTQALMKILLVAGQLAAEKGVDTFLRALRLLRESGEARFLAVIAGGDMLVPGVQTPFSRDLLAGLEDIVELRGRVDRKEMGELYAEADVFVHAGQAEAGPTTIIEALACGTPCILPDHACFKEPELVAACDFYPAGDPEALAGRMTDFHARWVTGDVEEATFLPRVDHDSTLAFLAGLYCDR